MSHPRFRSSKTIDFSKVGEYFNSTTYTILNKYKCVDYPWFLFRTHPYFYFIFRTSWSELRTAVKSLTEISKPLKRRLGLLIIINFHSYLRKMSTKTSLESENFRLTKIVIFRAECCWASYLLHSLVNHSASLCELLHWKDV